MVQQPIRGCVGLILLGLYGAVALGVMVVDTVSDMKSKKRK